MIRPTFVTLVIVDVLFTCLLSWGHGIRLVDQWGQRLMASDSAPAQQTIVESPELTMSAWSTDATCICNGTVDITTSQGGPIRLSSPYCGDGLYLQTGGNPSCCAHLPPDNRTHIVFSVRSTQYGHFLLNGMAPLWDLVRQINRPMVTVQQIDRPFVVHMFTSESGDHPFIREYLSMFGEAHIYPSRKLNETTIAFAAGQPSLLGVGNGILDHYNHHADPRPWSGFRRFLLTGHGLSMYPQSSSTKLRFTFVQRLKTRRTLGLESTVSRIKASLGPSVLGRKPEFRVVQFENTTAAEQAKAMSETDILIGADGTGLANGIYMPLGSCIISVLPYGVSELIPEKGANFENLFGKLGMKYIKFPALPVNNSQKVYRQAEQLPSECCSRYILLDQDIRIDSSHLGNAIHECLESTATARIR